VTGLAAALEATALAQALRVSQVVYPLVNAGHVLGIALLVGAVVPMDLRAAGLIRGPDVRSLVRFLRPFAGLGLLLAAFCGVLLFLVQATDYTASPWFRAKMALLILALTNVALHLRCDPLPAKAALLSLLLWPAVLVSGRMIAYG
jgi:hypothetical protein